MTSLVALLALTQAAIQPVKPPFFEDVQKLTANDPPAAGQILFIGSSSFTRWTDVGSYFPSHKILNRAFGGSTLVDQIRYRQQIVSPCRAAQIVLYCGENDLAGDATVTGRDVFHRFRTFFRLVRKVQPGVPFVYVSMKPSPSRMHLWGKMKTANRLIRHYLAGFRHTKFVDVSRVMLGPDGQPKPDIFVEDKLHMNASGYKLWQGVLEPVLRQ